MKFFVIGSEVIDWLVGSSSIVSSGASYAIGSARNQIVCQSRPNRRSSASLIPAKSLLTDKQK